MRIPDNQTAAAGGAKKTQETQGINAGQQGKRAGGAVEAAVDHVQLSTLAEQIRMEESASPERAARLEQLAMQVRDGSYEPDAGEVAESLIDESRRGERA